MAGEHRLRKQLYRRRYVLVRSWDRNHPGWWRLAWPKDFAGIPCLDAERL
jgi:hypothetical protein